MTLLKMGESIKTFFTKLNANFTEIGGKLPQNYTGVKLIYNGSATIPAREDETSATITVTEDVTKFDGLIFVREDSDASVIIRTPSIGTVFKPVNQQADYTPMFEGMNLFIFLLPLEAIAAFQNLLGVFNLLSSVCSPF
jgi:hypothetical protein